MATPTLKEQFFPAEFIDTLGHLLQAELSNFDKIQWLRQTHTAQWPQMELFERMYHLVAALHTALPKQFTHAWPVLKRLVPQVQGFANLCFPEYVARHASSSEFDFELAMEALAFCTPFGSSEFGVRPFLQQWPERTLAQMLVWASDKNEHIRRLASEGSRPYLPWAAKNEGMANNPPAAASILEKLRTDSSEYVRKSVANHLNDLSKAQPEWVLSTARRWLGEAPETRRLLKHALRTLLKAGNTEALQLMGIEWNNKLMLVSFTTNNVFIALGESVQLHAVLSNTDKKAVAVRLEFRVHYIRQQGRTGAKVFQWFSGDLQPGMQQFTKRLSMEARTTRRLYAGVHRVELLLNGRVVAETSFEFTA